MDDNSQNPLTDQAQPTDANSAPLSPDSFDPQPIQDLPQPNLDAAPLPQFDPVPQPELDTALSSQDTTLQPDLAPQLPQFPDQQPPTIDPTLNQMSVAPTAPETPTAPAAPGIPVPTIPTSAASPLGALGGIMNNKKILIPAAIGVGVLILAIVVLVIVLGLGGNKVACSKNDSMAGMMLYDENIAYFSGNKITKVEATGTVTIDDSNSMKIDTVYNTLKSQFSDLDVTQNGNSIVVKETITPNEDGDLRGKLYKVYLYGGDEISPNDYKKMMEDEDYTCK